MLADGGTAHLRPITPDDAPAIVALHGRLSERTRYLRYFSAVSAHVAEQDLDRFIDVDHHDRVGARSRARRRADRGRPLRPDLGDPDAAEVAFVVEDAHQGRGLGSILLEHLAAAAQERGIRRFVAEVLGENDAMVRVFIDAGYAVQPRRSRPASSDLEFDIDPTEPSLAVARAREHRAEARVDRAAAHPRSVAVIGASQRAEQDRPRGAGQPAATRDFAGPVYPVNSEHRSVRGRAGLPVRAATSPTRSTSRWSRCPPRR